MTATAAESFSALARRGSAVLDELRLQLEAELAALQQQNLDALRESTEAKQQLLSRFSDINRERTALLAALGVDASASGVRTWLEALPAALRAPTDAAWQQLQQDLEDISHINQRNEQVILRNSRNTDQLLSLMRGQNPGQTLYTATGTKGPSASQNRLGKA